VEVGVVLVEVGVVLAAGVVLATDVTLTTGVVLAALPSFAAAEKGVTAATAEVAGVIESVTVFGLIPNCCKVEESAADRAV
jgi:hypothetical protein